MKQVECLPWVQAAGDGVGEGDAGEPLCELTAAVDRMLGARALLETGDDATDEWVGWRVGKAQEAGFPGCRVIGKVLDTSIS